MRRKPGVFVWTKRKSKAAVLLAEGTTENETAQAVGVHIRTVQKWKYASDFAAEVDRLTLMVDVSNRAYRMRLAMRRVKSILAGQKPEHKPDNLLDWLKYAQSETDGVKLDIAGLLAAFADDAPPVAPDGSGGGSGETNGQTDNPA